MWTYSSVLLHPGSLLLMLLLYVTSVHSVNSSDGGKNGGLQEREGGGGGWKLVSCVPPLFLPRPLRRSIQCIIALFLSISDALTRFHLIDPFSISPSTPLFPLNCAPQPMATGCQTCVGGRGLPSRPMTSYCSVFVCLFFVFLALCA